MPLSDEDRQEVIELIEAHNGRHWWAKLLSDTRFWLLNVILLTFVFLLAYTGTIVAPFMIRATADRIEFEMLATAEANNGIMPVPVMVTVTPEPTQTPEPTRANNDQ